LNQYYKTLVLWIVIVVMALLLFRVITNQKVQDTKIDYSQLILRLEKGDVAEVKMQDQMLEGKFKNGDSFKTYVPSDAEITKRLEDKHVRIVVEPKEEPAFWHAILLNWFPMLLLIGVWIFFMRQMQAGGGKAMSFGKSKAKLLSEHHQKVTFDDVAGVEEAKEELEEIIAFLKNPKKFTKLGGRIPKGVLLVGAPGTGKTLLARAIAGEAGVPFFSISGSDFVEMFVGVGASRVRDLFLQGKKNAPCLIFIDEIDAVGRHRGAGLGGGHDEREQTLNQLLVEMDGFESNEGVILIAATNRPDVLDPALLRPGRFDRQVVVPKPDIRGREQILQVHTKKTPLAEEVDLSIIARGTPGFSGADLENLVNEAALLAARTNKSRIETTDFDLAKDKVLMGSERRSLIISEEEKRVTAYHEGGHALVAKFVPGSDPVHKVTIIPRGMALGVTQTLPIDDKHTYRKQHLLAIIAKAMGGRAAEEIIFGDTSTGAANDLEKAQELARSMVCRYGMSDLGPVTFGRQDENIFLGREFAQRQEYSEETAKHIDNEVTRILLDSYELAKRILSEHIDVLHGIAEALLERESLEGHEIDALVRGETLPEPEAQAPSTSKKKVEKRDSPGVGGKKIVEPEPMPT
jgi:cell division protease FtsH